MRDGRHREVAVRQAAAAERGELPQEPGERRGGRDAVLGLRGMRRPAGERDAHATRRASDRPRREPCAAEGDAGHVVAGEGEVGRDLAEAGIGDDRCGARAVLLGRLEHEDHAPARRTVAREAARERGEDRGVAVMAAEMRLARLAERCGMSPISWIGRASSSERNSSVGPGLRLS